MYDQFFSSVQDFVCCIKQSISTTHVSPAVATGNEKGECVQLVKLVNGQWG